MVTEYGVDTEGRKRGVLGARVTRVISGQVHRLIAEGPGVDLQSRFVRKLDEAGGRRQTTCALGRVARIRFTTADEQTFPRTDGIGVLGDLGERGRIGEVGRQRALRVEATTTL